MDEEPAGVEAEKAKIAVRIGQLKRITKKLYKDNACEILDIKSYQTFLGEYQTEQKQHSQWLAEIENELSKTDEYTENLQKISGTVRQYLGTEALTADMLNQMVDRIEASHVETVNGRKRQKIRICWQFISDTIWG